MEKKYNKYNEVFDFVNNNKYAKIGLWVVIGAGIIFLLGYVFRLFAHTINGYNQMKSAISNQQAYG